jgi:hypothetical protein
MNSGYVPARIKIITRNCFIINFLDFTDKILSEILKKNSVKFLTLEIYLLYLFQFIEYMIQE